MRRPSFTRPLLHRLGLGLGLASTAVVALGILGSACGSSGATPGGGPGTTGGAGIGEACNPDTTCRAGLTCKDGVCAATGTTANGSPCQVGDECASGNCGPKRTCDPGGSGAAGASCSGDADCGKGLRCAFDGTTMFPHCLPEGKSDVGKTCTTARDCLQGLVCEAGKCEAPPPVDTGKGIPPYVPPRTGTPWPGATCATPKKFGSVSALFNVPGSANAATSDDKDFFSLPFPNDAARKGGRVSYETFPHDPNPPMGFDAVKLYLDALADQPFGNYGTTIMRFDGEFDFSTVDIRLIPDADPNPGLRLVDISGTKADAGFGSVQGLGIFVSTGRNKYLCPDSIAVRPNGSMKRGGRYAVLLKKGVKDCPLPKKTVKNADGKDVEVCGDGATDIKPSPDLVALLGPSAPSDSALAEAYTSYAPLRDYLEMKKIAASEVLNASVFTVGAPQVPAERMRISVRADAAPTASGWTLCKPGVKSPCPQADGDRGCGPENPAFDELHALVDLPVFQKGTAPYLSAKDGGDIALGGDASTPIAKVRTEKVCLALTVPKGTAPTAGWPVAIYAHGTGGSFRSHAIDGSAAMLSDVDLGSGGKIGFAVLGIDQVGHGPRRCGGGTCTSTMSPDDIVFNFGNPQAARFNYLQGAADQHTLARLLEALTIDAGPTGKAIQLDPTKVVFWGHSQGATEGAIFLAEDPSIKGAVLSGEGAGLIEALTSKSSPVDIKSVLWIALSESGPSAVNEYHPVLSLLQNWVDPADPIHFARLDVVPNVGAGGAPFPRNLFQPSGTKDTYTPFKTQYPFAANAGLAFVDPIIDLTTTALPSAEGNIVLGGLKATAAIRQYTPGAYDGHFVAFKNDTAKADVQKFLARVAAGTVPKLPE
jgi:pimeloyl-ACP methyl ester carboxylesterase